MPYLNVSTEDFASEDYSTFSKFVRFVTRVLARRNNSINVFSMKLHVSGNVRQVFVEEILNYAFYHNIQQLNVICLHEKNIEFPLSHFNSKSLKQLTLTKNVFGESNRRRAGGHFIIPTSTWELPALTTLDLHSVILCDDNIDKCISVFSKCANLKNLSLKRYKTVGSNGFTIRHPRLSNLTLENGHWSVKVLNVVAPQLENLTIKNWSTGNRYLVSAPCLASLLYNGCQPLQLCTEGFGSLEKADICVSSLGDADANQIVCLLQQLHSVKYLTLNLEIVELQSSSVELISQQAAPFANLKSLNIYPESVFSLEQARKKVTISNEVKSFLLNSSPRATFVMVSREEIIAAENSTFAQNLMAELRVLLEQEKANTETNMAQMHKQRKAQLETQLKLQIFGSMAQVKNCWEDMSVQIEQKKAKAYLIISKLQSIEELLTKLPASNRAVIHPLFSSLCGEADVVINIITDCMKIQCEEYQRRLSVCFREFATTLQLSS